MSGRLAETFARHGLGAGGRIVITSSGRTSNVFGGVACECGEAASSGCWAAWGSAGVGAGVCGWTAPARGLDTSASIAAPSSSLDIAL